MDKEKTSCIQCATRHITSAMALVNELKQVQIVEERADFEVEAIKSHLQAALKEIKELEEGKGIECRREK